jgi:hypothetical protein
MVGQHHWVKSRPIDSLRLASLLSPFRVTVTEVVTLELLDGPTTSRMAEAGAYIDESVLRKRFQYKTNAVMRTELTRRYPDSC